MPHISKLQLGWREIREIVGFMLSHLKSDVLMVRFHQIGVSDVWLHVECLKYPTRIERNRTKFWVYVVSFEIRRVTCLSSPNRSLQCLISHWMPDISKLRLGWREIREIVGFMLSHLKSVVLDVWFCQIGVSNVWFHSGWMSDMSDLVVAESHVWIVWFRKNWKNIKNRPTKPIVYKWIQKMTALGFWNGNMKYNFHDCHVNRIWIIICIPE